MEKQTSLLRFPVRKDDRLLSFAVFVAMVAFLNIFFNAINHRLNFSDLKVYYMASESMISGGEVYTRYFGLESGYFKYSPGALFLFLPLTLLPLKAAGIVHLLFLCFCYWYSCILSRNILRNYFFTAPVRRESLLLSVAAFCALLHLVKEVYLGNINIILILICLLSLAALLEKKPLRAGILLGTVLLFKPFFGILLLPLLLRRKGRSLAGMLLALAAGILMPYLFLGFSRGFYLTAGWFESMTGHTKDFPSLHTIDGILRNNFFPGLPGYFLAIILMFVMAVVAWMIFRHIREEKDPAPEGAAASQNTIMEWFLLMALVPCLFNTDSEHFLVSLPIITYILYTISAGKKYLFIPLLVIAVFFYGGNSNDLLGKDFSARLYLAGLTGAGNLMLIAMTAWMFYRKRKRKEFSFPVSSP